MCFTQIKIFIQNLFNMNKDIKSEEDESISINWKSHWDTHFPNIGSVYLTTSEMNAINKKLTLRNKNLLEKQPANYSPTIHDHLAKIINQNIGTEREQKIAGALLNIIDIGISEFKSLTSYNVDLFPQLKKQLKGMFHDNEAKYLEKIAELLASVYLIKNMPNVKLASLEEKFQLKNGLPDKSGKDADLLIQNQDSGETSLIDIVNIALEANRIETATGLENIIKDRIEKKWESKNFNDATLKDRYNNVQLQIFIWIYNIDIILKFKDVFLKFENNSILPFLFLVQYTDANGRIIFKCQKASEIDG